MSLRNILVGFIIFLTALFAVSPVYAQKKGKSTNNKSSTRIINPVQEARMRALDSTRAARQAFSDSVKEVRERRADSIATVRKYKESKKYKDSVAKARQVRVDAIKADRTARLDSIKAIRTHAMDSAIAARKAVTDSIRAKQKKRSDSLAAIRKYRESKRYQDSVVVVRKQRLDSIKEARMAFNDSVSTARKNYNDSLAAERKAKMDSATAVRMKYVDSLKAVRKVRSDSLAKVKEKREKATKDRLKNREDKLKLQLELKIAKKRKAWSNEKMLKKRWSPPRKAIQNTFTRYNYYFNSERKMEEAEENMRRVRRDNFDSTLTLFPFDPDRDSASIAPDMDSIIQKTSIGVQLHDPRTKWGDDLYLLMGRAYYYKGDYDNASITFKYIVSMYDRTKKKKNSNQRSYSSKDKNKQASIVEANDKKLLDFMKHRSVHNESLLWLARTFTEWHKEGEAESVIDLVETDPNLPENLRGRLALEKAYINLSERNNSAANENLAIVANDKDQPGWIRQRAAFINGQLLYDRGDFQGSAASYAKVIDLQPKIDMDFYARKNMAYSLMMGGGDQEEAVASLRRILKDGKYIPYYEQVYFVIGKLSANTGKTDEAIDYLTKSIRATKATKRQKALSFAALGNVYYGLHKYDLAKLSYDSASMLASAVTDDTSVDLAIRRAVVLDYVTRPAGIIHMQDSLLLLASLSDRDQRGEVRRYIRHLRDLKNDSIFTAENAGLNAALQNQANTTQNNTGGANYANWYFSNPAQMQQGLNEFKRKWGNRTLADKWRRASAISLNAGGQQQDGSTVEGQESGDDIELDEDGLPTEEALMAYIPNGPERKEQALKNIRRAYIDLADAYINRLEDYPEATATLDTLNRRFPTHEHKAEELYLRYVIALRQSNLPQSKVYANQLLEQYPDSRWAKLVRPTEDGNGLQTNGVPVAEYHDITYGKLLQREYNEALARAREGEKSYKDDRYNKKFRIIEAVSLLGVENYDLADSIALDFIKKHPADSLRPWADMVLDYTKKYRAAHPELAAAAAAKAATGKVPVEGELPAGAAPSDSAPVPGGAPPTPPAGSPPPLEDVNMPPPKEYAYDAKEQHYVIFGFPVMEQRAMGVKAAIGDFNTFKFGALGLNVGSEMLSAQQGLVVVRTFENAARAKIYLNELKNTAQVFREYKTGEYQLFLISASNYLKLVTDKGVAEYYDFYRNHYK